MTFLVQDLETVRPIVHRTSGRAHGVITRLASPHDLGELIKPFVFLDLLDTGMREFSVFGLHPHSGIATLTYIAEGSVSYEDTNGAYGLLAAGGVEWMRAGQGVWHGGGAGESGRTRGFQLWIALPPHLELGPSVSIYQDAEDVRVKGPARVLLGAFEGASSAIQTPSKINYLALRLAPGERWQYRPPAGHDVLWIPARASSGRLIRSGGASWQSSRPARRQLTSRPRRRRSSCWVPPCRTLTNSSRATIPSTLAQKLWQRASSAFASYVRNSCSRGGCDRIN
jgi:redox-sensitive bicupin YhaK (pirin superfamily)